MNKNQKTVEILQSIFSVDTDTNIKFQAQNIIGQFIVNELKVYEEFKDLNYSVFVNDTKTKHWKPKEHFVKIFNEEIEHAKGLYCITRQEVLFLYSLSPYLMWELNLLVDKENNPLNQKQLAQELEVSVKTIQRNMNSLIDKKMIYATSIGKEVFYLVNPFVMYCGRNINIIIPSLFVELGYIECRVNRRNKVKKRNKVE